MYGRKYKGDRIDPTQDFRGAVANRSKMSVCTIPSLHASIDEHGDYKFGKSTKKDREYLFKNYIESRRISYLEHPLPEVLPGRVQTELAPMPKQRKEKNARPSGTGIIGKLGKRLSTIGDSFKIVEDKETSRRSISLPDYPTQLPPKENASAIVETKHIPKPIQAPIEKQEQNPKTPKRVSSSSKKVSSITRTSFEPTARKETKNTVQNSSVYVKDNKLHLKFSNNSTSSLVSQLLDAYSKMTPEEHDLFLPTPTSRKQDKMHTDQGSMRTFTSIPRLENNQIYDFNSAKTCDSTCGASELFSNTQSYSTGTSNDEFVSFSNSNNGSQTELTNTLETITYTKKLPPIPVKEIDQFQLRDYSHSDKEANISDESVPPPLPKHSIIRKNLSRLEKEDIKNNHQRFSFPSKQSDTLSNSKNKVKVPEDTAIFTRKSRTSVPDSTSTHKRFSYPSQQSDTLSNSKSKEKSKKKNKEKGPDDTAIFTRKSRTNDTESNSIHKKRVSSFYYLKNVGIERFMLNGYEPDTPLKVVNS